MMQRYSGLALFVALLFMPKISYAQQVCSTPSDTSGWGVYSKIVVVRDPVMHQFIRHVDGSPWNSIELDRELRNIVSHFNVHLPSGLPPLVYYGSSYAGIDVPGQIYIRHYAGDECAPGNAVGNAYGTPSTGAVVQIARGVSMGTEPIGISCDLAYQHFSPTAGPQRVMLRELVIHEIMHTLGGHHPSPPNTCADYGAAPPSTVLVCDDIPCSIVAAGLPLALRGWEGYVHDVALLTYNHQGQSYAKKHEISSDGNSWSTRTAPAVQAGWWYWPIGGTLMGATDDKNLFGMYVTQKSANGLAPRLYYWNAWAATWSDWGEVGVNNVMGQVDVAYGGSAGQSKRPHVAFMGGGTAADPRRELVVAKYNGSNVPDVGNIQSFTYGSNLSRISGASIAFNPISEWFVIAWRDNSLQIQLTFFKDGIFAPGPAMEDSNGNPLTANETPSVVCGEYTGYPNCLLVWADNAEDQNYNRLHWTHFSQSIWSPPGDPGFVGGPLWAQSIAIIGRPQVTWTGSANPFMITWGPDYNSYSWTMVKNNTWGAGWTGLKPHGQGMVKLAPVAGSAFGYAQILHNYLNGP